MTTETKNKYNWLFLPNNIVIKNVDDLISKTIIIYAKIDKLVNNIDSFVSIHKRKINIIKKSLLESHNLNNKLTNVFDDDIKDEIEDEETINKINETTDELETIGSSENGYLRLIPPYNEKCSAIHDGCTKGAAFKINSKYYCWFHINCQN